MVLDESLRLKIMGLKNTKPNSELGSSGDERPPEIESHFGRLSNLLNRLKSITDQAPDIDSRYSSLSHDFEMLVIAALREAECADLIEKSLETDLTSLCGELKHKDEGLQASEMALARLEETSKAMLAELESRIQNLETQLRDLKRERQQLTSEKDDLLKRLNEADLSAKQAEAEARQFKERLEAEFSDRRRFMAKREESLAAREADLSRVEADQKADIENLQLRLQDTEAKLASQEKALTEKESGIHAAAVREAEMGKLIERLSSECERLGAELSEKQLVVSSRPETKPLRSFIKRWQSTGKKSLT